MYRWEETRIRWRKMKTIGKFSMLLPIMHIEFLVHICYYWNLFMISCTDVVGWILNWMGSRWKPSADEENIFKMNKSVDYYRKLLNLRADQIFSRLTIIRSFHFDPHSLIHYPGWRWRAKVRACLRGKKIGGKNEIKSNSAPIQVHSLSELFEFWKIQFIW